MSELLTPCIESNFIGNRGYGMINSSGKRKARHRVEYERLNGPIPDGMCVMHLCDNPRCYNTEHLTLGTHKENMQDAARKGRIRRNPPVIKTLSQDVKNQIRELNHGGLGSSKLAARFNLSRTTIRRIIRGYR